ncbi:MAG: TetR/AcrR family transcriptional regulator [Bdellovibrionaceae bacterium]|nr:TetR/AcrR family transcriptional regulator [Pseudobdellovibrionaceae bacterium]MBX3033261.1 TetR/AcrR family transcriptional regulator [Pseudobdellovibrionaceae bacterium]
MLIMKPTKAPKRRTRNLEKSRREILDVAFFEVFTRGFQGVSVDDIVKKTSLTKGAFYHHFPTKLDLGYALVEEVVTPMILDRWITPLKDFKNPLEGILQRLDTLIGRADPKELRWGCPLNNLVQEMAPVDAGFRKRLERALTLWIDEMDQQLQRARRDGYLSPNVRTRDVAHFLVMTHEGFYGLLKGLHDPKAFDVLYSSLKRYFQTIETQPLTRRNS